MVDIFQGNPAQTKKNTTFDSHKRCKTSSNSPYASAQATQSPSSPEIPFKMSKDSNTGSRSESQDINKLHHPTKQPLQHHSQQRSRSGSDANSALPQAAQPTTLRAKLGRNMSPSSVSNTDNSKTKMKLKLQLSQANLDGVSGTPNLQTTPVFLSPRGTPNTSPDNKTEGFFTNFETYVPTDVSANSYQSHLDSLLDESAPAPNLPSPKININGVSASAENASHAAANDVQSGTDPNENSGPNRPRTKSNDRLMNAKISTTTNTLLNPTGSIPKLRNSTPNTKTLSENPSIHPLQTKLYRYTSSSTNSASTPMDSANLTSGPKSSKSPKTLLSKNKSRNIAYQTVPEPVRPQTSILKSNFNTKFSQQYQQQEKMYLTGITKYRNRYKNADDYYVKSAIPEDVESSSIGSVTENPELLKLNSMDSDIFGTDSEFNTERNDKNREYEALKALSQQIGSESINTEFQTISEYSLDSNLLLELLNRNDEIHLKNTRNNGAIFERLEWQTMLQTVLTGNVVTGEKTKFVKPLTELEGENLLRLGYKEDFWLGIRAKLYGRTIEEQKRLVLYHRGLVDKTFDEIMNFKLEFSPDQVDMSYTGKVKFASQKVNSLLDKYERCQELWRTQKEMETDKPQCATPEFANRINCLVAWTSVTDAIERESDVLKRWVGNDDLDILRPGNVDSTPENVDEKRTETYPMTSSNSNSSDKVKDHVFKDDRPFVERILKEKDIENLFNKRLFSTFSHWTMKAKKSYLEYHHYFNELGLPSYLDNLFVLTNFPSKLMKEIMKTRLEYAQKLKNPTIMMIDQTIDDLKMYLRLALEIRISMLEYCAPADGWISFPDYQDIEYDNTIIQCITYYMSILNRKLLFSPKGYKSFRTFKEPEELEKEWLFLQNIGFYINDLSVDFLSQITGLFIKLINRLYIFIQNQIQGPPSDGYRLDSQRLIRWYTSLIENFGQLRRKLIRFEMHLFSYTQNSFQFKVLSHKTQTFFTLLKESNHALYHNSKIAEEGVYIFVSESLVHRPYDVECILKNTYLGVDFSTIPERHLDVIRSYHPSIQYYNTNSIFNEDDDIDTIFNSIKRTENNNTSKDNSETINSNGSGSNSFNNLSNLDYVLVIVPPKALMWDGIVVPFNTIDKLPIGELGKGDGMFMTKGGRNTNVIKMLDIFRQLTSDAIGSSSQICCSVPSIERNFQTSLKLFSRITCLLIDSTPAVRNQCRGVGKCQELVNNVFISARDVGRDSIRNVVLNFNSITNRGTIVLRLIKLAIEWLSFIVDDCSPTDPKTFRWCVAALEFAMDVTKGFNILTLDSEKFYRLKDKVAGCMSLLISHFDIMGARAKELQKKRMQNYDLRTQKDIYTLDDESLGSLRQHIMFKIHEIEEERRHLQVEQCSVGRVLDDTDMENQLLTYLASSFSSVSIRWQKGKFLGGGTFGSVYACVNLDTGGPMAVKEIRFQDRQSIKTVVPAIKGEMSVLELLSHPNIVQFFGVEVHRDRVYIFMEYCSGGSLSGLLEYGRIEDEIVIQLYTLQMLEALAYLHQFGIVHRDVKPDNILLDHLGVIKFVDFGSAKVIAIPSGHNTGNGTTSSATNTGSSTTMSGTSNNEISDITKNVTTNEAGNMSNLSLDIPPSHEAIESTTSTISSTISIDNIYSGNGLNGITEGNGMNASTPGTRSSSQNINRLNSSMNHTINSALSSLSMSTSSISPYNGLNARSGSVGNLTSSGTNNTNSKDTTGAIVESIMESKRSHALTGTPMYMSPETIKGENMGKFGAMDIWSLGCCVLEMATGRRPWSNLDNEFAVMYHIAAGHLPQFPSYNELSAQGQEFLAKCLTIDPTKRASAVELLQDPWIQAIRNEAFSEPGNASSADVFIDQ